MLAFVALLGGAASGAAGRSAPRKYLLTVVIDQMGTVTAPGVVNCTTPAYTGGKTCYAHVFRDQTVKLQATEGIGFRWVGWDPNHACGSRPVSPKTHVQDNHCSLRIRRSTIVGATFAKSSVGGATGHP